MYIIKLNEMSDKYMCFTHPKNRGYMKPMMVKQDSIDFVIYFETRKEAEDALEKYINSGKMKLQNVKYTEVKPVEFDMPSKLTEIVVKIDNYICHGFMLMSAYDKWKKTTMQT